MKGKVVIITGGSSGIGKGIAKKMAEKGANVVITGRTLEKLEETKKEIEHSNGQILTIQMDVRNPDDIQRMIEETDKEFGRIDFLVNNAAGNFLIDSEKLSVNGWKAVIDIVLNGTFYCSSAVGNYWIERGIKGQILNIIATYAWGAGVGVIHSASAKAGVLAMTRTLAVEWGMKYGIRANAIAPGPIENTGGAARLWESEEQAQKTINHVPLKRLGQPEEIANLSYFMLSDEASYLNGEVITMDGGRWLNNYPF